MLLTYVFEFRIILLSPNMQTFLSLIVCLLLALIATIRTWNHQSSHSGLQPQFSFDSLFESLKLEGLFFFSACNAFLGVGFWKEQLDLNFLLHLSGGGLSIRLRYFLNSYSLGELGFWSCIFSLVLSITLLLS